MRLMIPAFAAVVLFAVTITMLWSHLSSTGRAVETASIMSLQEIQNAVRTDKLPIDEIEDQSLVFPTATKR
jgi:hypothetical protein